MPTICYVSKKFRPDSMAIIDKANETPRRKKGK